MTRTTAPRLLLGAANLSLIAVLIHAWMGPAHLVDWWGSSLVLLGLWAWTRPVGLPPAGPSVGGVG